MDKNSSECISNYLTVGKTYDNDQWIDFWAELRRGPLKDMTIRKLETCSYSSLECYFSWTRTIDKKGNVHFTINKIDIRPEKERRN